MSISCCKFAAHFFGVAMATQSVPSLAVPFGSSASGSVSVPGCSTVTLASIPITVDVTSRIFATVTGVGKDPDSTYPQHLGYSMVLRDAGDTTNLASSTGNNTLFIQNSQTSAFSDSQVLTDTNGAYIAAPGNYLLKVVLTGGYVCQAYPIQASGELTYILLSSVLDRIFANGFSMISASNPDSAVA